MQDVLNAVTSRRSIRGFLDKQPDPQVVRRILTDAARAPSGTNMQPWRVHVLTGAPLKRFTAGVLAAHDAGEVSPSEYKYYPDAFFEPYLSRRRAVGLELYRLVGVPKGDAARMKEQVGRNFTFFDAPVGLIFTIDRRLEVGSWLDYGMFMQNIMTLARAHGLDTCAQAAFAHHHETIRTLLDLAQEDIVVAGMSLGYADMARPENTMVSERAPLEDFVVFHD